MPILGSTASVTSSTSLVRVKDYGALGDNSHDDTTAIQTAINVIKANVGAVSGNVGGQELFFDPGFYKVTSTLDFTGLAEVRILGYGGRSGWRSPGVNPAVAINYTAGGSSTVVNMAGSQGCVWDGVSIWANGGTYTGVLLSLDTLAASDIYGHRIQNCQLRAVTGTSAVLLSMAGNIEVSCDNVTFSDAGTTGAQVRMVNVTAPAHWSNANSFRSCSFIGTRQNSILNPGPQTTLVDCTFEPSTGGVPAPIAWTTLGNEAATAFSATGCGFWDNTASTGSWIKSTVATSAFSFTGCKFSVSSATAVIDLSSHSGLALIGCEFDAPNGGTPNIFAAGQNITNGAMLGCYVKSPIVDNHAAVFV